MRLTLKKLVILILTTLCLNIVYAAGPPSRVKPVVIDIAEYRELAPTALYSGTVISKNDARLSAEVEGRLTWVAEVGTKVSAGDVVAKLDDFLLQQQRNEELATIESERAKLELHQKEVKRYQRLIKQNNVAENLLDEAISDRQVAQSNISVAQARLAQINERISRSDLRATFSGIITERFIQAGEWAQNGSAIVRLVDIDNPEVQVRVPQSIYPLVSIGNSLDIVSNNTNNKAVISTIVPVGTTASRLFELRLSPKSSIPPGTLVQVAIPTAPAKNVISIHRDALVIRKGSLTIFRINEDNTSEQLAVKVGIGEGDHIELIGPVNAGDQIVIRGGERLRPGEAVSISSS